MSEEMLTKVLVGPQVAVDGQWTNARGGNAGELITSQLNGKYYELNRRGMVYCAATGVAGVVLPVYTATAHKFMIWNQATAGINVVPLKLVVSMMGTPLVSSSIGITPIIGAGVGLATGNVSAFAKTNPVNMKTLVATDAGYCKFSVAATTLATSLYIDLGFQSNGVFAAASTTWGLTYWSHDFDGTVIVGPQNALCVVGAIAQTSTLILSLFYAEIPA